MKLNAIQLFQECYVFQKSTSILKSRILEGPKETGAAFSLVCYACMVKEQMLLENVGVFFSILLFLLLFYFSYSIFVF